MWFVDLGLVWRNVWAGWSWRKGMLLERRWSIHGETQQGLPEDEQFHHEIERGVRSGHQSRTSL